MKKFIFTTVAGVALLSSAFAGYNAYQRKNMSAQDILTMQNIEALTQTEITIVGYCSGFPYWQVCLYDANGNPIGSGRFVRL